MQSIEELLARFTSGLNDIAHAIRAKTGKTDTLSIEEMAAEQDAVFEAGKAAGTDAFWDDAQDYGQRYDYAYGFSGAGWTDETFKPKYNMVARSACHNTFCSSAVTDLKALLENAGVTFDTGQCSRTDNMFSYAKTLTRVPELNVTGTTWTTGINSMFDNCLKLHTIEKLIIPSDRALTANGTAFRKCESLVDIFIEGVISANGWDFKDCPLSKASITSVINALSATTSGLTVTLKKTSVEAAFGSTTAAEWTALVATKPNWTISLA